MGSVGRAAAPGRSLFYRMGPDPLHSLLAFLDLRSLLRLDSAATNKDEREGVWLPALRKISNAPFVKKLEDWRYRHRWLDAFRWMILKDIALPSKLMFPSHINLSSALALLDDCTTAHNVLEIFIFGDETTNLITTADLMHLRKCSHLNTLGFNSLDFSKIDWRELKTNSWSCFATVKTVELYLCSLSKQTLLGIRYFLSIEHLLIYDSPDFDDVSLALISALENLTHLTLQESFFKCSEDAFVLLQNMPRLKYLKLQGAHSIDEALKAFKTYPALESLHIEECIDFTDATATHLSALTSLTSLQLSNGKEALPGLSNLTRLVHLDLSYNDMAGAELRHL